MSLLFTAMTYFNIKRAGYRTTLLTLLDRHADKCDKHLLGITESVLKDVQVHMKTTVVPIFNRCGQHLRYVEKACPFLTVHPWTMGPEAGETKDSKLIRALYKNTQLMEYIEEIAYSGKIYDDDGKAFELRDKSRIIRKIIQDCEQSVSTCIHLIRYEIANTEAPFIFLVKNNRTFDENFFKDA